MGSSLLIPTGQPGPMMQGEFTPSSNPNRVSFGTAEVTPPSQLYLQRDDVIGVLVATSQGSETVTIGGRLLEPDGKVQNINQTFKITAGIRVVQQFQLQLMEGWLLGLSASAGSATQRGMTFCRIYITRGGVAVPLVNIAQMLLGDYITQNSPLGWPGGRIQYPTEGQGNITRLNAGSQTVGNEINVAVPTGARWNLRAIEFVLVTSAAVANRQVFPFFNLNDASTSIMIPNSVTQAASLTRTYFAAPGPPTTGGIGSTAAVNFIQLPFPIVMSAGGSFASSTLNKDVGDQFTQVNLYTEEFLDV